MSKKSFIFLGIFLLIFIIAAIIYYKHILTHHMSPLKSSTTQRAPLPKEATITLDKNGFTPSTVTIKVGSATRWENKSGDKQTVNSDNYPTNQLHKELNFGVFNNGSSVVYTFTKPGTYGYHNQFHPKQKGKVIVEN